MPSVAGQATVASGLVPLARRTWSGECLANRRFLRKPRFAKRLADLKAASRLEYGGVAEPACLKAILYVAVILSSFPVGFVVLLLYLLVLQQLVPYLYYEHGT